MNSTIKKLYAILPILLLASCVVPPPPKQCPQLGINIDEPNFHQRYDNNALNSFYSCSIDNSKISVNSFGFQPWSSYEPEEDTMQRQALNYQWNLWQQIYVQQTTSVKAQNAWAEFHDTQSKQMEQIKAQRAADDARSQAFADQAAAEAEAAQEADEPEYYQVEAPSTPSQWQDSGAGKGHGNAVSCEDNGTCTATRK